MKITWSGACSEGVAVGQGTLRWKISKGPGEATGTLVRGKRQGRWVERNLRGTVAEGPYADGEMHGRWVARFPGGNVAEGPYVDSKMHGQWVWRFADGDVVKHHYVNGVRR